MILYEVYTIGQFLYAERLLTYYYKWVDIDTVINIIWGVGITHSNA